jgi:hypothetical protein
MFEKTKPICRRINLTQALLWKDIIVKKLRSEARKNKANPSTLLRTGFIRTGCCVLRIAKGDLKKQSQFFEWLN